MALLKSLNSDLVIFTHNSEIYHFTLNIIKRRTHSHRVE